MSDDVKQLYKQISALPIGDKLRLAAGFFDKGEDGRRFVRPIVEAALLQLDRLELTGADGR